MRSLAIGASDVKRHSVMGPLSRLVALFPMLLATASAGAAPRPKTAPAPVPFKDRLRTGIVTVRVTGQEWNWKTPWAKQSPWTRTMSGLVVEGPHLLVANAGLGNHLLIEVQKEGRELRTPARLSLVDHEGPLGVIDVDDAAFWKGLAPLPLAERIPVTGEVTIHRWQRSGQVWLRWCGRITA